MWCQRITHYKQRIVTASLAFAVLFVAVFTTAIYSAEASANSTPSRTLNFQGRLLRSTGAVVPDGHYNIQFKIYEGGTGAAANNPDGTLKWTENYVNNNATSGVRVKNGLFSVNLGSVVPFGETINWNADTIWLSMNIAGAATDCTTFGTGSCAADGEMLPMKQMTATPFAMNAGQLGGKTADNFLQLAQGVQTDASNNTSSIFINKTGTGNLVQLQNNGADVFSVTNTGSIALGGQTDHTLSVGSATTGDNGNNLTIHAGYGSGSTEARGGSLFLRGGGSGGVGGDVFITAGYGDEQGGSLYLGVSDTAAIQIGNPNLSSGYQTIAIGNANSAGGVSNVTIGSGGGASGGATNIQSKDDTTISTDGTQRARFSGNDNTLYLGNADTNGQASVATGFTIQGTSSTAAGVQGGSVDIVAGSATNGNANGGNLTLRGGSGSGSGAEGLVVIATPTFQASTADANCFTGGAPVAQSCTFTSSSVNSSSVLMAGFSTQGQIARLPDPAITTPGRIMYVTAGSTSQEFTLRINEGSTSEASIAMSQNISITLLWNGADWTLASAPPVASSYEFATNGGAETAGDTTDTFPANTWTNTGYDPGGTGYIDATVTRYTTVGNNVKSGQASVRAVTKSTWSGARNKLKTSLTPGATYTVTASIRSDSGTIPRIDVYHLSEENPDTAEWTWCTEQPSVVSTQWTDISCTFEAPAVPISTQNSLLFTPGDTATATFYIDDVSLQRSNPTSALQVQNNAAIEESSPLAFSRSATPTTVEQESEEEEVLGSMYYDIEKGKVQCYEAEGWGSCGTAPDTFVSLSPSFPGAVIDESSVGDATFSTGFCSDSLGVNNSTDNPICDANQTRNYYELRANDPTGQESRSTLYVTHTLPENFKEFVPDTTHIAARSLGANTQVTYQFYKNRNGEVTPCGTATTASTGTTSWQEIAAQGDKDPSRCDFGAGDNVLVKIELTLPQKLSAEETLAAYVSDINFVYRINN